MKSKLLNDFAIPAALIVVTALIYFLDLQFFESLEQKAYDLKVVSRDGSHAMKDQVVIAAIDEQSLKEQGRWPWPRTLHAQLIDKLAEAGAKAVAFNIFFPENDLFIPMDNVREGIKNDDGVSKDTLKQWLNDAGASDRRFVEAIRSSQRTILAFIFYMAEELGPPPGEKLKKLLEPSIYENLSKSDSIHQPDIVDTASEVEVSLPEMSQAAVGSGFSLYRPDSDGVARWAPMVVKFGDGFYSPLTLQILKHVKKERLKIDADDSGFSKVHLGPLDIPVSPRGEMLVNYRGQSGTFSYISATDILKGKVGADKLKDKIVLIGGTAKGTYDSVTTPYGPKFPEVEVHANVIENILSEDFLTRPNWLPFLDLAIIIFWGIVFGYGSLYLKPWIMVGILGFGIIAYVGFDYFLFIEKGLWLNIAFPVFAKIFIFSGSSLYHFYIEDKKKRFIQKAFSKYLSPVMVNQLIERPELLKSGGEERYMTVMFSDLEGFTSVAEKLGPVGMAKLMTEYFTEMTAIILKAEGTVNQYAGDLVMSTFGAPLPMPDHAERAVTVGLKMQKRLAELCIEWAKRDLPPLRVRTGVNSSGMFFGNLGSEQVFYYSVMGDAVNLSARLESANKQYGTYLMISEETHSALTPNKFLTRTLDVIIAKGKTRAVKVYEVYGFISDHIEPDLFAYYDNYAGGFEKYLAKDFDEALKLFQYAENFRPGDKAVARMIDRVKNLDPKTLPDDWDGSFTMTSK